MTTVWIDGDVPCYAVAFRCEDEPLNYCLSTVKKFIQKVVRDSGADDYVICLTGSDNFRKKTATLQPYKGNRKAPKPKWHGEIRKYLEDNHPCVISHTAEADDTMGEMITLYPSDILATIDKDLDMIPGWHYNWMKKTKYLVQEEEGDLFFGIQMLTGDATDNIPGLYKMTGQKASKALKAIVIQAYEDGGFVHMMASIKHIYLEAQDDHPECRVRTEGLYIPDVINEIGDLLWIRRADCKTFRDMLYEEPPIETT